MDANRLIGLTVLNEEAYFREITRKVGSVKKGDRIALITMAFDADEPRIATLMRALTVAAKRGAHICFAVDAHSFMVNHHTDLPSGPLYYRRGIHSSKKPYYRAKVSALDKLKDAGGQYHVINVPQTRLINPVAGRSHIKATVINNDLYVGGCNLGGSDQLDLMVYMQDEAAAAYVYELIAGIAKQGSTWQALESRDLELALDAYTSLLVDSGRRGQSLIYDQALELIDTAEEWLVMTCQYFPNSTTARHLAAARERGVQVRLFYNHPAHQSNASTLAHRLVLLRERARHHKQLFALKNTMERRRIHAKLIATEQGAIIGSHNYVTAGIRLGTAEAAILRRDSNFAQQAAAVIEHQLAVKVKE